jgi:DNA-binding response OmpR family regulator
MPSVVIVEDDPGVSGMYTYIFKRRGFNVVQARDSMEGLKVLEVSQPDAIILDLLMPGENGIEFLKRAKLHDRMPNTKVFVVSNVESDEFAKQLEPFKIAKYVTKAEYTPNRVVEMVEESLAKEAGGLRISWLSKLWGKRR